jgi:hypothetical protein
MPTKTGFSSLLNHVRFRSPGLIAAAACCLVVTLAFAGKPVPPPPPVNVTSIVHDKDTSGNNLFFQGDDLNHTSGATYTSTGNVKTAVGNPGGWGLDLYNQVARTVCLTFSRVDGAAPGVPNGCYSAIVEIYSHCHDLNGNEIGFLTIEVGAPQGNCTFGFDFNTGATKYKWEMGQSLQSSPTGGPTGLAIVTCNASSGTTCVSWTIAPNTGALNPTVANLYDYGHHGLEYLGQYYLTYRIDATNP